MQIEQNKTESAALISHSSCLRETSQNTNYVTMSKIDFIVYSHKILAI